TVQDVSSKAHCVGKERPLAELCQINTCANADWNAHTAREQKDNSRTNNRVRHATALFSNRSGDVRKERQVQRAGTLVDEVEEDCCQWQQHNERGNHSKRTDYKICGISSDAVASHRLGLKIEGLRKIAQRLGAHRQAALPGAPRV